MPSIINKVSCYLSSQNRLLFPVLFLMWSHDRPSSPPSLQQITTPPFSSRTTVKEEAGWKCSGRYTAVPMSFSLTPENVVPDILGARVLVGCTVLSTDVHFVFYWYGEQRSFQHKSSSTYNLHNSSRVSTEISYLVLFFIHTFFNQSII